MKTIWKFQVPVCEEFTCLMPGGAQLLCVRDQDLSPTVWALVETYAPEVRRRFHWHATGTNRNIIGTYVGTIENVIGEIHHLFDLGQT